MRPKRHNPYEARRVPERSKSSPAGKIYVYGKHALMEAPRNTPRIIRKGFLAPDLRDAELHTLLEKNKIPTAKLAPGKGKEMVGKETAHQRVIFTMDTSALLVTNVEFLWTIDIGKDPSIAVLGEVQDPNNVGAIIRSAAAFGLSGVLIPEPNYAGVTGAVVKSSAGMTFRIPLVTIGNVNNTLKILKEKGFWIDGLAMNGTTSVGTGTFDAPSAFVVRNENAGIREKTLEACDVTLSIPIHERTESLNAAVSAAVVFYEWSKKHPEAL